MTSKPKSEAPDWFTRAVATPVDERSVEVAGCPIHYSRWGPPGRAGVILVHGGFAHRHWWDFIAPFLAERYCVVALDLSGMGDSGHRPRYTAETFAQEVMSVCEHAGLAAQPMLVGHSFGGLVALKTAVLYGERLSQVVLVDFPVRPPESEPEREAKASWIKPRETYLDLETALKRFKLIPPQPCENRYLLDYIARHSVRQVAGGWMWKFDDRLFQDFQSGNPEEELRALTCRAVVIYGERSALFPPEIVRHMSMLIAGRAPMVAIPEAHHHVFLDQPLAFVSILRLLAESGSPKPLQGGA